MSLALGIGLVVSVMPSLLDESAGQDVVGRLTLLDEVIPHAASLGAVTVPCRIGPTPR